MEACKLAVAFLCILAANIATAVTEQRSPAQPPAVSGPPVKCAPYLDTQKYRTTNFQNVLNTTVAISPQRPNTDVPVGSWITGRATYYGTDPRWENIHTSCGEPAGQFGILAQGSCGYTNSDGSLVFPKDTYAAAADTNEDYPGSCGRCYQIRCKSGQPLNNGRPLQISDLPYYKAWAGLKDDSGRVWPGNPYISQDKFYVKCWDDAATITVRISDSCPCKYHIQATGEIRTQNWCCGGNNHFDLSFWAFQRLAHPGYGVMPLEYRPVDCATKAPLKSIPGYVNQTIYDNTIRPGWTFQPYSTKNTRLLDPKQGIGGSTALCSTISQGGAIAFICRSCSKPGYQPFAKAKSLQLSIRSNTQSLDPFASSTPPGELPQLKIFMMNDELKTYCGAEVVIAPAYATKQPGGWYNVSIPLSAWRCIAGSVGSLAAVDRFDIQNTNIRDANICLDNIKLA